MPVCLPVDVKTSNGLAMNRRWILRRHNWVLALLVLTLAVRVVIPTGFMPTSNAQGFHVSICNGTGNMEAWIGLDGKIHKEDPGKGGSHEQPCAFAGLAFGGAVPEIAIVALAPTPTGASTVPFHYTAVAIGRGLAAPPPPQTGPPALI